MKNFKLCVLQEFVRNPLEISNESIVSNIPFKFAFQTQTFLALCQKLPTAYFSVRRANFTPLGKVGAKIRQVAKKFASPRLNAYITGFRAGTLSRLYCKFAPVIKVSVTMARFCTEADCINLKLSFAD